MEDALHLDKVDKTTAIALLTKSVGFQCLMSISKINRAPAQRDRYIYERCAINNRKALGQAIEVSIRYTLVNLAGS